MESVTLLKWNGEKEFTLRIQRRNLATDLGLLERVQKQEHPYRVSITLYGDLFCTPESFPHFKNFQLNFLN